MSNIANIIDQLTALNLKKATSKEVEALLNNFEGINTLPIQITTDNYIVRSRYFSSNDYYDSIDQKKNIYSFADLSYNPTPSGEYKRCTIPGEIVFYGTLPNDKVNEETFNNALFSSTLEATGLVKNGVVDKKEKEGYILCSAWKIHRPLIALPVINNLELISKSPFLLEAVKHHKNSIDQFHPDKASDYHLINEFLSKEFSKVVSEPAEYKISAIFSNTVLNHNDFDGILYPSVAGEGDALNLACKQNVIDSAAITPFKAMVLRLIYEEPTRFIQILYCDENDMRDGIIRWKDTGIPIK